jgi:hypothetical protein
MKDRLFSGFTERAAQARDQWATKIAAGRPMDLTTVYDCMGSNLGKFPVPHGVLMAGYTTGSGGVPWTPAQFTAHPGAIQIDQSPQNTPADELADVIDVEQFAATIADIPAWVRAARANWAALTRPGQRWPMIYCSGNTLTPVANALNAAGITTGVSLWLAKPMTIAAATDMLSKAGGPFPIDAIQHTFLGDHDVSLFNTAWLGNVSGKTPAPPPNTKFTVQVERYQPGFGWVLSTTFETPPAERYRARVYNGDWSDWQEFTP